MGSIMDESTARAVGHASHSPPPSTSSASGSRQYQTAQRLRHTIGGTNKVWACDRCYRLKIKCDSARPTCASCRKHDLANNCTYGGAERTNNSKRGRRYDTAGYVRMLEARVREVEGLLQDKQKKQVEPRYSPAPSVSHNTFVANAHFDHAPAFGALPARVVPHDVFSPELKYDLCRTFFTEIAPFVYSCPLHEPTFLTKMCIERPDHSEFHLTTLCALAAPYSNHPIIRAFVIQNELPNYRAGEPYFYHARAMIDGMANNPSLDLVIGLFWLSGAAAGLGKEASLKYVFFKQAITMAVELKLNVDPDVEEVHGVLPWLAKEIRRRIWWCLCSVRKHFVDSGASSAHLLNCGAQTVMSLQLDTINALPNDDRPPSIDNRDHPTTDRVPCLQGWRQTPRAPCPEALFQSVVTEDGLPRLCAFVPGVDFDAAEAMVSLTKIFSRIKQLRGSAWAMARKAVTCQSSPNDTAPSITRQERIVEMESDLRAWLAALPDWAQNIDQFTDFAGPAASKTPPPWQLYILHLFYHASHIALHLPAMLDSTLPPSPRSSHAPLDEQYVAHAYSICRQHAHRTSILLRRAQEINPTARFLGPWSVLFGFYSAMVLVMASKASGNKDVLADVRRDLDSHLWLLRNLADKWFTADRTLEILIGIIQEGEGVDEPVLEAWSMGGRVGI